MKTEHGRVWYAIGTGMCGTLIAPASEFCIAKNLAGKKIPFSILTGEDGEPFAFVINCHTFPPDIFRAELHDLGMIPLEDVASLHDWPELQWAYEPSPGQSETSCSPPLPGNPELFRILTLKSFHKAVRGEDLPWTADVAVGCLLAANLLPDTTKEFVPNLKAPIEYNNIIGCSLVVITAFHDFDVVHPNKTPGPSPFNN